MQPTYAIALALTAAMARAAAQDSAPTSVMNVTMLNPEFRLATSMYGRVVTVESDLTTIALDCRPPSEGASRDPCSRGPTASVIVAPEASSTVGAIVTHVDVEYVSLPGAILCHRTWSLLPY